MADPLVPEEGTHLTDGWEPDTPADDTLVRGAVLAHASWPVDVASALGRPWRRTDRWAGGCIAEAGALSNPVVLLRPLTDPRELLSEVAELFAPRTPYFLLSPFPTPDLREHGLALIGHPPLMVRLPASGPQGPAPRGVEIREVGDVDELAVAERVLVEGYPMPELQPLQRGSLFAPALLGGRSRLWVGYVDGEPASVAMGHVTEGAVLVEYVAALPTARGRGAGAAVTWAATTARSDLPAVLIASDDGRPVYERLGYLAVVRWTAWVRLTD